MAGRWGSRVFILLSGLALLATAAFAAEMTKANLPEADSFSLILNPGGFHLGGFPGLYGNPSQSLWGPHDGFGFRLPLTRGISLVAGVGYERVDFRAFGRLRYSDRLAPGNLGDMSGFFGGSSSHSTLNWHGFSIRIGIRIDF